MKTRADQEITGEGERGIREMRTLCEEIKGKENFLVERNYSLFVCQKE